MTETISKKLSTIAENVPKVYDAGVEVGKKAEYDAFWDVYQNYGKRSHYMYGFAYAWFNDETYNPKYPITPNGSAGLQYMFFWNDKVTDTKVPITAFGGCSMAFANASKLKRIPKLIFNGTTNVASMFLNATDLEELNCEGELAVDGLDLRYSSKLNKASIISVINVLSATTSGLTVTFSEEAVDKAFETTEGANDGSNSMGWLVLTSQTTNWTISLI